MIEEPEPSNQIEQEVGHNRGQTIGKIDNGQAVNFQNAQIQNVIFQPSGASSYQTRSDQFQKEVPYLLPYLANRREQEAQLSEVFSNFLRQDSPTHLVCIIHGDELQCHNNFLERMRKVFLPKWLNLDPQEPILHEYLLEWPSKSKDLHNLSKQLCKNLADVVLKNSLYSPELMNIALSKHHHPVIVHTYLLTEDLHKQGLDSLNKLLEFCHDLHRIITSQRLIICILIRYKIKRKKSYKNLWLKLLFNLKLGFLKQYRYQKTNNKIRKYLQVLSNSNMNYIQSQSIIVLPELSGINQGEVENWVRCEDTKQFVGEAMIEPLIQKVGEMFDYWEEQTSSDTIPMSYLAEELSKLVKLLIAVQGKSS
ncbi:MAG: hypothetical protein V7K48_01850 [Nostoc sp.]|uniref:hypothetical protein n=1 Tax=Nostoc sp. TaxID=1180 RepID=UPI002FFA149C